MTLLQSIILGILQGFTEFLPVSSSGHLVLFQQLFGITEGGLTFGVLVHFGTLVAVFIVYRDDIVKLIKNPFQRMNYLVIIGAAPTAIIGIVFKPVFEQLFDSVLAVGVGLIITGFLLWIAESHGGGDKGIKETKWYDAITIGIAQGLAITPGISRMGFTVSAGLLRGLDREMAAKYSFLLSIPVILGANVLEIRHVVENGVAIKSVTPYIVGPIVAAVSGVFAIKILLNLLRNGELKIFSYYVWALGAFLILQQAFL